MMSPPWLPVIIDMKSWRRPVAEQRRANQLSAAASAADMRSMCSMVRFSSSPIIRTNGVEQISRSFLRLDALRTVR